MFLVEVCCHWCDLRFYVCQRCWRGQAYCCEECGILGSRRGHREAQRRYLSACGHAQAGRQTPKGKKAHRQGENRPRHGLSQKNEKKMADRSSKGLPLGVIGILVYARFLIVHARAWFDRSGRCHFCGCRSRVVDRFVRRD